MLANLGSIMAPLAAYSEDVSGSFPRFDRGGYALINGLAAWYQGRFPDISTEEFEGLVELSREAGRVTELLEAGDLEAARELIDQRWEWIMAWGDEAASAAVAPPDSSLPRPPACPPTSPPPPASFAGKRPRSAPQPA